MKRTIALSTMLALMGSALVAAPADAASGDDLSIQQTCVLGEAGVLVSFTQDGTVRFIRDEQGVDHPVSTSVGLKRVNLPGPHYGSEIFLVRTDGSFSRAASAPDATCDGWFSRDLFEEVANYPGAAVYVGPLSNASPVKTSRSVYVYRGTDGAFYLPDETFYAPIGHAVKGSIYAYYRSRGEYGGFLGYPRSSEAMVSTLDGYYTSFDGGVVYWSAGSGAHAIRGALLDGYAARGYERGGLGLPAADEIGPLKSGGFAQRLTNGSLYWSPSTGVHAVRGPIYDLWAANRWEQGYLGYPVSDELPTGPGGQGRYQRFQGGVLYWSAGTGARTVRGALFAKWGAFGWENGLLGFPTVDEFGPLRDGGYGQHFQNGSVYWSAKTGAHVLELGPLWSFYQNQGWENGYLGYPTSDTSNLGGGSSQYHVQSFQGGVVYYQPPTPRTSSSTTAVRGAILDAYLRAGGPQSSLGYPRYAEARTSEGTEQVFYGGTIKWDPVRGARIVAS